MSSVLARPPEQICLLRLSAIGDVCHTVPVVRALQAAWPECRITWVMGATEAQLVGDLPGIESIIFDKRAGLSAYRELARAMRGRHFDALLMMQVALRSSIASLLIPADTRVGFDLDRARDLQWLFSEQRISPGARQHVMEGLFGFARALGVEPSDLRWDIPIPEAAAARAATIVPEGVSTLVISPCSSQRARNFRNWRPERYAEVADHASSKHGMRVVLTGGPTELERGYAVAIQEHAHTDLVDVVGDTSLKELLAVLGRADVVVCPDSGPAHMATAVATPVIGLYATSNPDRTGPFLSREWVVDRYPEALWRATGKKVENARWGQRVRDPDAMELIEADAVIRRLDDLMTTRA